MNQVHLQVSQPNNITNGYPTSNSWGTGLGGSYFNNFTPETHVSEILRFIAKRQMSHSLDVSDVVHQIQKIGTM